MTLPNRNGYQWKVPETCAIWAAIARQMGAPFGKAWFFEVGIPEA
ncbi:hypothetical protein IQ25_02291 [Novosphingobium taihuense]|nr:hypothetical protein IQ25_02291 [Novosphingobium taihuense]